MDHATGPPAINDLDFSEFHPIDHLPATARCRSLPGGTRRHISRHAVPDRPPPMGLRLVPWATLHHMPELLDAESEIQ